MLSSRSLLIMAQGLLIVGVISLLFASVRLFSRAVDAGLPVWNLYWIIPLAMGVGVVKAMAVMRKTMARNIKRLRETQGKLWPWQIYPARLLIFIVSMILLMFVLKRVLAGNGLGLGLLGGVDVVIAVALLVVSREYRR